MCVTAPQSEGLTKTVGIMVFSYLRIAKKKKKVYPTIPLMMDFPMTDL